MNCSKCNTEMELSDSVLLSNPPIYKYFCPICGHEETLNSIIISKPSFKLDFTKVNNWNELLWLLNEVDLHVHASHPKYDELKSRFS